MAIRNIREIGDPILHKKAKEVRGMTERTRVLIGDMIETMHDASGVGLAAPQVGVLRRIAVVDVSEEGNAPIVLVNPEILETEGEQRGQEGCLSVPGKCGIVTRPSHVKVRALNERMEEEILEGEGILARALCHEIEHLDGHLYVEKVEGRLFDVDELAELAEDEAEENPGDGKDGGIEDGTGQRAEKTGDESPEAKMAGSEEG